MDKIEGKKKTGEIKKDANMDSFLKQNLSGYKNDLMQDKKLTGKIPSASLVYALSEKRIKENEKEAKINFIRKVQTAFNTTLFSVFAFCLLLFKDKALAFTSSLMSSSRIPSYTDAVASSSHSLFLIAVPISLILISIFYFFLMRATNKFSRSI